MDSEYKVRNQQKQKKKHIMALGAQVWHLTDCSFKDRCAKDGMIEELNPTPAESWGMWTWIEACIEHEFQGFCMPRCLINYGNP